MFRKLPVVCFDTSAHNRIVEDGTRSEPIIAGLKSGFFFRFAGLSIDELISCPDPAKRAALLRCCARLQHGPSDCIFPPNELIRDLIVAHHENPEFFDWKAVNVRAVEYERGIQRHKAIVDDALSSEQRTEQSRLQKQYKQMFSSIRPKIEAVFAAQAEARPTTFRNVIARLENLENSLMWGIGKLLYDRAVETNASESRIKEFLAVCAPFRALIYALLMSWYDLSVRDTRAGEHFGAGRNDLFMAVPSVLRPVCNSRNLRRAGEMPARSRGCG
jgi:hypothetical protein